jgi:XXXCH domain-containing protein
VEVSDERQDRRHEYKALKERMKADFRQIRRSARKRGSLDMELVRAFCSDARLMTEYPGKGDERYPEFLDRVGRMAAAAELWSSYRDLPRSLLSFRPRGPRPISCLAGLSQCSALLSAMPCCAASLNDVTRSRATNVSVTFAKFNMSTDLSAIVPLCTIWLRNS